MDAYLKKTYGKDIFNATQEAGRTYEGFEKSKDKEAYLLKKAEGIISENELERIFGQLLGEIRQQGFDMAMGNFEQELTARSLTDKQIRFYNLFLAGMKILNVFNPSVFVSAPQLSMMSTANPYVVRCGSWSKAWNGCTVMAAVYVVGGALAVAGAVITPVGVVAGLSWGVTLVTSMASTLASCFGNDNVAVPVPKEREELEELRQDRLSVKEEDIFPTL